MRGASSYTRVKYRGTLLVVDDSPDAREFITVVAVEAGYRVLSAESARDALSVLRAGPQVDALIVDYSLEDGTGVALVHQAINEGCLNTRLTPTFVCTAYRYVELPPTVRMLQKPVEPHTLLRALGVETPEQGLG